MAAAEANRKDQQHAMPPATPRGIPRKNSIAWHANANAMLECARPKNKSREQIAPTILPWDWEVITKLPVRTEQPLRSELESERRGRSGNTSHLLYLYSELDFFVFILFSSPCFLFLSGGALSFVLLVLLPSFSPLWVSSLSPPSYFLHKQAAHLLRGFALDSERRDLTLYFVLDTTTYREMTKCPGEHSRSVTGEIDGTWYCVLCTSEIAHDDLRVCVYS